MFVSVQKGDSDSDSQGPEEDVEVGDSEDVNNDANQSQEDSYREEPQENQAKAMKCTSQSKMSTKKKANVSSDIKGQLKPFVNVANTASQVLSHLAKKRDAVNSAQHTADKDWDYCKFLYHKLKEVPEGDIKDELQLNMQQMISRAKRDCSMQRSSAPIPCPQAYQQPYPHHWMSQGQGTLSANQCPSNFSVANESYSEMLLVTDANNYHAM